MSRQRGRRVHGLLILLAFASACSAPVAEPAAPTPTVVETQPSSAPSAVPSSPGLTELTETPTPQIEYPRDERCTGLLEVVDDVHEDPRGTTLPEPFELIYENGTDSDARGTQLRWTIRVWPRLHETEPELVFSILHEIGHLFDGSCLTIEDRLAWMEARGTGDHLIEWTSGDDWTRPNEDYADAFAVCQGGDAGQWRTSVAEPPTQEECSLAVPVE